MVVTVEVIDAVQRTLEQDGLLQSIKAQLRSNVLRVIKQSGERIPGPNPNVRFIKSAEGRPIIHLVRDLLLQLNLRETLIILDAETGFEENSSNEFDGFISKLGLSRNNGILLEQLVSSRLESANQPSNKASPKIEKGKSISRNSSEDKYSPEMKTVSRNASEDKYSPDVKLESSDDFNIPDMSSAINFSKFMNKSRAEQKEMTLGDDIAPVGAKKISPPTIEEKAPALNNFADDLNDRYKNIFDDDDDDDDDYEFDVKPKSKPITPTNNVPVPVKVASPKEEEVEEVEEIEEEVVEEEEEEEEDDYNFDVKPKSPVTNNLSHPINITATNRDKLSPLPSLDKSPTNHAEVNKSKSADSKIIEESDDFTDDYEETPYKKDRFSHLESKKVVDIDQDLPPPKTSLPPVVAQEKPAFLRKEEKEADYAEEVEDDEEIAEELNESVEQEEDEDQNEESEQKSQESPYKPETKESSRFSTKSDDAKSPEAKSPEASRSPKSSTSPQNDADSVGSKSSHNSVSKSKSDEKLEISSRKDPLPGIFNKASNSASVLGNLPELKVPGKLGPLGGGAANFLAEEKKQPEKKEPEGPEFDSDIEEEEESYSQLDQDISQDAINKSFESSKDQNSFSNIQNKVVTSKLDEKGTSNRAAVNRLSNQGTIRSTRGWNDVDDRRNADFAMEDDDEDEDETDQTELPASNARNVLPGRQNPSNPPPARSLQLLDADDSRLSEDLHQSTHDQSFSQDSPIDNKRHQDQEDAILHMSYRSNQEEEEEIIHHEEEEENVFDDDYEDDAEEDDNAQVELPMDNKPKTSLFAPKQSNISPREEVPLQKAFTNVSKVPPKHDGDDEEEEEEEDENNEYDDYGDDFENEEENNNSRLMNQPPMASSKSANNNPAPSSKAINHDDIEEIEEDIEEDIPEEDEEEEEGKGKDDMSVGGQSSEESDGLNDRWGKPKALLNTNSSMFRQRSGPLPSVTNNNNNNNNRGRYNFSNLHDSDEEEEDDDDDRYSFDAKAKQNNNGNNNNNNAAMKQRMNEIDSRLAALEESDEAGVLQQVKSNFNNNGSKQQQRNQPNRRSFDDDISVASDNLSVGKNSGEESFSLDH